MREIIESCLKLGSAALLMISGYIFGTIWGKGCVYLLDSHSKDYEGNISQNGCAILMKFENLDNFQDYIKLINYSSQHHKTLYFQMLFISIRGSKNLRESIKSELILNGPKQCITKKRKLENSQAPEMLSAKKQKNHTLNKFISETDSFVGRSIHISKIVQGIHHQGDIRYGSTAGIQCLCISLMAVCWSLIKSISRWDSNDLDRILRKSDELFKSLNKFKLLGVEDVPTKTVIYSHCTDNALLENRTGEITSSMYMTLIGDIVGNCSNLGNGALLTINGYALGVIWGKNCFFLFDLHSKNSRGNICQNGTSVLLKSETLSKLQEYVKIYITLV